MGLLCGPCQNMSLPDPEPFRATQKTFSDVLKLLPSPSSAASSSLPLAPETSISSSSAVEGALASSLCVALPLRRALRSFSWVKTNSH